MTIVASELLQDLDLILNSETFRNFGISHFDNSANNKFNPDPTKEVRWGDQNRDEMSTVFLGLLIDINTVPKTMFKPSGPSLLKPVPGKAGPTLSSVLQKP
jgi:hypothetical protein